MKTSAIFQNSMRKSKNSSYFYIFHNFVFKFRDFNSSFKVLCEIGMYLLYPDKSINILICKDESLDE